MSVERKDHGWERIKRELMQLEKHNINAGILSDKGSDAVDGGYTLAQIAAFNEFGTDRIPERPAHRTTFENSKSGLNRRLAGVVGLVAQGKISYTTGLERLGNWYTGELKQSIINWNDPPNADSTVRQKGFNNPLIETGRTVNSIDFEIVRS